MNRTTLFVWCALVLSPALSVQLLPHTATAGSGQALRPGSGQAAVDAVVHEEMRVSRIPGVAVAVVENGAIVLQRAYGVADLEHDTPMTTNAVFEIASITKQFTAAAVMMLVEEGKIRLDDPVSAYIEGTPATWEKITIRHLLTHTSGMDISAMPRTEGIAPLRVTKAHAFSHITAQPLQWPVGQNGWYSDAGYVVLGLVIEKASGQTYRDFITERVFEPLRMHSSSLRDLARVLKGRVPVYSLRDRQHVNWRRVSEYEVTSAFGIYSTLQDLAAWDGALRQATLLRRSSLAEMWTPATINNRQRARVLDHYYGFGWELADVRGRPTVGHGGASGTYILRFVDEPLTIILLTNLDTESGRHPRLLAAAIAGAVRPGLAPPHMLPAKADPDPERTKAVQMLLTDIGARRPSSVMSKTYRTWYDSALGSRVWMSSQLGGAGAVTYLGRDDLGGRSLWGGEPLAQLIHYSTDVKGRTTYLSVGITADGSIGSLDFYRR